MLALYCQFSYLFLFITITMNLQWLEILDYLLLGQTVANQSQTIVYVFYTKMSKLI